MPAAALLVVSLLWGGVCTEPSPGFFIYVFDRPWPGEEKNTVYFGSRAEMARFVARSFEPFLPYERPTGVRRLVNIVTLGRLARPRFGFRADVDYRRASERAIDLWAAVRFLDVERLHRGFIEILAAADRADTLQVVYEDFLNERARARRYENPRAATLARMTESIRSLERSYDILRRAYGFDHPKVVDLGRKIEEFRRIRDSMRAELESAAARTDPMPVAIARDCVRIGRRYYADYDRRRRAAERSVGELTDRDRGLLLSRLDTARRLGQLARYLAPRSAAAQELISEIEASQGRYRRYRRQ